MFNIIVQMACARLFLLPPLAGGSPTASTGDLDLVLEGFAQLRRQTGFSGRGWLVQADDAGTQTSCDLRAKSRRFGESLFVPDPVGACCIRRCERSG